MGNCNNRCSGFIDARDVLYMGGTLSCINVHSGDTLDIIIAKINRAVCGISGGTVTSIAITSDDITITGSPITTSGTFTLTLPDINANVGEFNTLTVNVKGQVLSALNTPYIQNITGLVEEGANITITGAGTTGSPYIINSSGGSSTPYLQQNQIAFGDGSNLMTSSANFTWDGNALNISSTPGTSSGWGNIQEIIASAGSEAGIALNNTSAGGRQWNIISTSNSSGIGGDTFSVGDASSSINYLMFNGGNIIFPTLAGNGVGIVGVDNTGTLSFTTAGGTVTSVATGTGLTGGVITSSGTISLDSKLSPLDSLTGNSLKLVRVNAGETAVEYFTPTYGTGTVTSVATTGPIQGGTITSTGTISITQSTTSTDGYLSSIDWNTFNNKGNGSVTSVDMSVPTGLSISGNPVTTSGTLALTLTSGYIIPTTTEETNWNTAYTNRITSLTTSGTSGAATLISNVLNIPQYQAAGTYITSVSGTSNRITSTGGTTPVIDISASYVGQTSITTLGTVTTGTLSTGAIVGGVTMTLGSDASYDLYYRNSSGILTRLANGTTGQLLTATTSSAPSWTTVSSGGVTTLAAIGSSPNANAATISGSTLNLEPASASFGGVITTGTQTIAGAKTFTQAINDAFTINGTWTATANSQRHLLINPSITFRSTASDEAIGIRVAPTFTGTAASQIGYVLDIDNTGAGTIPTMHAMRHKGNIFPSTTNTYNFGSASLYYSTMWNSITRTDNIRMNTGATLTYFDGSAGTVSRMYVTGDQMWASNGNIDASSNGYKIQAKGEGSIRGGIVIPALSTPVISSVTNTGSAGATTYTYKVVAKLTNGATTDASAAVSTTTGNATLSGSNYNIISYSEVVGATGYDIYRTVGGATQGKIGTRNSTQFSYSDQSGASGDGSTAPSTNSTGNLGVGVTTPTASIHVKAGVAGLNGAPIKLTSGTNLTTAEAGAIEYDGTNLFFSPSTTRHTVFAGLAGSATLDFGSVASLGNASLTITVTGAADGDPVNLGVPNGSMTAGLIFTAWVSAANTVSIQCYNSTLGAIDPASGTFKVFVKKN